MKPSAFLCVSVGFLSVLAASTVFATQPAPTVPKDDPASESHPAADSAEAPLEGVGSLRLPAPGTDAHKTYLGIDPAETFAVSEIQARVLIVEVFSMYCPHCQREAPRVNALFRQIAEDPGLSEAVKLIGIGVGNSAYEVDVFRKQYDVPFPLFPDPSMAISNRLGAERTPTFIAFSRHEGLEFRQILFKAGDFGDPESFLKTVAASSGISLPNQP